MVGPAFVTGGSGFVGGALVEHLVGDGREVVALARSEVAARRVAELGARPVRGDVLEGDLEPLMAGAEVVFHVAGINAFCVRDPQPMMRANIQGSQQVVKAAARAEIGRVVYTSSAAAIGEEHDTVGREDSTHRGSYLSDYERSKHEAEIAVISLGEELGIDVVSVNPSSVQGAGRTGGTGKLFIAFLNGKLRALVRTTLSIVDIRDCSEGHVLAEAHGVAGERYLLNGATLSVEDALDSLRRVAGIERRTVMLPGMCASFAGAAVEGLARMRGRAPSVCRETVRALRHGHRYDGSRAERELGLHYTPFEATLREAVEWYRSQGLIPPG